MKRNNIFKSAGTLLVAGIFATTFAACDGDTNRQKGSTYEGAEEIVEAEETRINQPTVEYENGDYNIDQEYAYEDRELVRNRLRQDIDRADRSLEQIEADMERGGENVEAQTRQEWEESKQAIQRERDRLSQRLDEVENSTEQNWERVRNDVNTTLRDWEREWDNLRNKDVDVDVNVRDEGTDQ
ncbi:hypothetical protein [Cesiribacter sp. SM1]|uniref:hypothetical protein n=1 Tax=Cesiribacter sp. SM1 TaxID=2861196 RepID=UPI001CD2A79B|nr:hypothetical protein [Cesiribacter sp. SM1]